MKAFAIGLLTVIILAVFAWIGFLLLPFLVFLEFSLQILCIVVLAVFAVWGLGKLVIFCWRKIYSDEPPDE